MAAEAKPQTKAAQLTQVKNQLSQELQHLSSSFQQLKTAQVKFRDCNASLKNGLDRPEGVSFAPANESCSTSYSFKIKAKPGTNILIPLTASLYVPAQLATADSVLVDIGTGFFVEKAPAAAQEFYTRKVDDIGRNLVDLEKIVQGKQGNLAVVEDGAYHLGIRTHSSLAPEAHE